MIKQLILPLVAVAAFIILVGLLVKNSGSIKLPGLSPSVTSSDQKSISVNGNSIMVELAKTKEQRTQGLSARSVLTENAGMLFIFETQDINPGFWMKGMLIPLDIVWINDGKVVKIDKNVEAPKVGTPDSALKIYSPDIPIDFVLEVNAGYSDKNGIKTGDPVTLPTL